MPLISFRSGTYEGELDEHKLPHGNGQWKAPNGDIYKGQWKNGKPHGKGIAKGSIDDKKSAAYKKFIHNVYSVDSEVQKGEYNYDGEWVNGKMSGTGMYTYPNGDFYDGEWQNNLANGTGMYMYVKGSKRSFILMCSGQIFVWKKTRDEKVPVLQISSFFFSNKNNLFRMHN